MNIEYISLSKLHASARQPRTKFEREPLEQLAESILVHGILQPLVIRKDGSSYEIIAGERRFRAAKLAGLEEVPAVILGVTDERALQLSIVENLQRENLNPVEIARSCRTLIDAFGLTQEQVAKQLGVSRSALANTLRLLSLPEKIIILIEEDVISEGHGRALLGLKTAAAQIELAKKIVKRGLTVRQVEKIVRMAKEEKAKENTEDNKDPNVVEMENILREKWGTKVTIKTSKKGGQLVIDFYSNDDFNRLLDMLG